MIDLNLTRFTDKLRFSRKEGKVFIFDSIRKKFLVKAPEEIVRQLTVHYLIEIKGFSKNRIAIEKSLKVNELDKRFDILVYNREMEPWLLVECKAPAVPVTQDTFHQIARYNLPLRVKYLLVTNGLESYCCSIDYELESFQFLTEVPSYLDSATG